jgi:peptidoglycan/LPS O-acetylase OafA/YrhL
MEIALQKYAFDPILAVLAFSLAIAVAGTLVLLFDRIGGAFGKVVEPSSQKLASVEGLRGILAFSVATHHAYCWYFYTQTGVWTTGNSIIFSHLASFGVMQFFFLSGFLFWRKLMKRGRIPFKDFIISRYIRIAPAFYACFGSAILIGLAGTGFHLQVPMGTLLLSLLSWFLFAIPGMLAVNQADILRITSGVAWTLALEWQFYFLLPFLGWYSRKPSRLWHFALTFTAVLLTGFFLRHESTHAAYLETVGIFVGGLGKFMLIGFGGGILIAALDARIQSWQRFLLPGRNWILVGLYLAYLIIHGNAMAMEVFLVAGFALVVQGADLFGFLTCRAVRLLGIISYPLYLVHGIVYYLAMKARGGMHAVALPVYLGQTALCFTVIILLATLIHVLIERPTMKFSERIARRAQLPQTGLLQDPSAGQA